MAGGREMLGGGEVCVQFPQDPGIHGGSLSFTKSFKANVLLLWTYHNLEQFELVGWDSKMKIVYLHRRSRSKSQRLDTLHQRIQCRVWLDRIRSRDQR
jgi:hypothetical protein